MSYMKDGRAGRWAAREFETEAEDGKLHFQEWTDFEDEFRKEFTLLNEEVDAVNVLETASDAAVRVGPVLTGFSRTVNWT